MSTTTLITSTDPKGIRATSLFQAKYNKAKLDDDRAQRLNEDSEFWTAIGELIAKHSRPNQFASEEVVSRYAYPKEYQGPKPIEVQIKALAEICSIDPASALEYAKHLPELPQGAEGWFAIISPATTSEAYCLMVNDLLAKLAASRPFTNWREGQLTPNRFRVHPRTAETLAKLQEIQKGGILIIAAQFGMLYRGYSTRRAREKMIGTPQFGLEAVAGISVALTHPERFVRWEELDIDLPGNEFDPDGDGQFVYAPFLDFDGGKLEFDAYRVDYALDYFGSASGVAPQ